jgi:predicted alpha/beta superfamily hydrolase
MPEKYPEVPIFQTELRILHSEKTGIDYHIPIWFPPGYPESRPIYPVVYALDASAWFGMCANITLALVFDRIIPDVILVGIAYPLGEKGLYLENSRAPQFLDFLKDELIPFMESNYPVDPIDRAIWGVSAGGFFALYTLFHEPKLFTRIIAGSAFWESGCEAILGYEREFAAKQSELPVKLFLSVGSLETEQIPYFERTVDALIARNYTGLEINTKILDGEVHWTQLFPCFLSGMRWLFANQAT